MVGKVARGARDSGNMGFLVNYRKLTGRRLVNSVRFFPSLFLFLSLSLSLSILEFVTRISLPDIIFVLEKFASFVDVYYSLARDWGMRIMERKVDRRSRSNRPFSLSRDTQV